MTWQFFETYCDEPHIVLTPDWFSGGKSPTGLDLNALTKAIDEL